MQKMRMIQGLTLKRKDDRRMTSLEIAEVTGKRHNDVLKAIQKWKNHG